MFKTFVTVAAFILPVFIISEGKCPPEYQKLTKEHTFCLPPNKNCDIKVKGISPEDIAEILAVHNELRSRVATGQEKLGGGLPTASNMIELTWDGELQEIAQKWAEQCDFNHDCDECHEVSRFPVGQNLAQSKYPCQGDCKIQKSNWKGMIKDWYSEVADFEKKFVSSMQYPDEKMIGHFTQVAWAETSKIGCGYAVYKDQGKMYHFYVCNYGPSGNFEEEPMYEAGTPCSNCPKNSCCGETCKGKKTYSGLCHLN